MIYGQLWATKEPEMVQQAIMNGFKIIYVGDPALLQPQEREAFVIASSLVPDYAAMSMHIDGDEKGFVGAYYNALSSKASTEMISAMIACLHQGYSIMIYNPAIEGSLEYIQYLLKFLEYNYGLQSCTKSTPFRYDPRFNDRNIEVLYLNNLVDYNEFLRNTCNLDDLTLNKLTIEVKPPTEIVNNKEELIKYFADMKAKLSENLMRGMMYEEAK